MTTTTQALDFQDVGNVAAGVVGWVSDMPPLFWQIALVATIALFVPLLIRGRKAARRIGEHAADRISAGQGTDNNNNNNKKLRTEKQLLWSSLIVAGLFWMAVLVGSGRGLAAFGRDTLHWKNGWDWLVPATLDGVAVVFAFLAFRALVKHRNPDRSRRIVWGATASSAFINFVHELTKTDGAALGAIYLGVLSILGMAMLDEFLRQFEEGAGYIKREKPVFGLRWITLPYPTLCAWLAWTNYPPVVPTETGPDGKQRSVQITIRMAVEHLEDIRAEKGAKLVERDSLRSTLPWWTHAAPWVRARKLQARLDKVVRTSNQERSRVEDDLRAEMERRLAEVTTLHSKAMEEAEARRAQLERRLRSEAEARVEEASTLHASTAAEVEERMDALRESLHEAQRRAEEAEHARVQAANEAARVAGTLDAVLKEKGGASTALTELRERQTALERKAAEANGQLTSARELVETERRRAAEQAKQTEALRAALQQAEENATAVLRRMEATDRSRAEAEAETSTLRSTLQKMETEAEALRSAVARMEAEVSTPAPVRTLHSVDGGSTSTSTNGGRRAEARPGGRTANRGAVESDETKLYRMFVRHPAIDFEWDEVEVRKAAQVGYSGRAGKLLGLATNHLIECSEKSHADCFKEHAPADEPELADASA